MSGSRNESNIMKTIGLLLNKIHDQTAPLAGEFIRKIIERSDFQICIFSNKTMNLSDIDACMMSVGTIVNFTGDIVCFNSADALLCLESNRDINIKYCLHEQTVENLVRLLPYHKRVEFVAVSEDYKKYTHGLIEDEIKTVSEYLNEKR